MSQWLFVPKEIRAVMNSVDDYLQVREKGAPPRGYEMYHPSALGKCLRSMQYARYAERGWIDVEEKSAESRLLRLWETGHATQARWEKYFTAMGVLKGVWTCANPFCAVFGDDGDYQGSFDTGAEVLKNAGPPRVYGKDVLTGVFKPEQCACGCTRFFYDEVSVFDKELNISGHADMILDFSDFDPHLLDGVPMSFDVDDLPRGIVVADMKTCNKYAWDKKVTSVGPSLEYQIQLTVYANLLGCECGILIYENKNDSKAKAFKIERNEDTWWLTIKKQIKMMNGMVELKKLPPPRPLTMSDYECKNCPFSKYCHASSIWEDEEKLKEKRKRFYKNLL